MNEPAYSLATVDSDIVQTSGASFPTSLVLLSVIVMIGAALLYIKSKKSKSQSMMARPSEVKQQIKQKMMEDQESFVISEAYDTVL
jgi:hypothetical protein